MRDSPFQEKKGGLMRVGICAIIKDCYKPYLVEWFNHHHEIGVEQFYVYDNESDIPIIDIVEDLPFKQDIHIETITGKIKQFEAYHKCLADIKSGTLPACDRVAFIDDDEFIICENGDIKDTLKEYTDFPGLGISWRVFGSSEIKEKTSIEQRMKFTQYTTPDFPVNKHIKSIVNPFLAERTAGNPHSFVYSKGNCVNVNKEIVENAFSKPVYKKIWLNHYFTRSLEEWDEKIDRGRADLNARRTLSEFYEIDFNCSGKELKQIHLVIPFYRKENRDKLIEAYRPMGVILHPIMFEDEVVDFPYEPWIEPCVIAMDSSECKAERIECYKRNWWIGAGPIVDDDYYVCVDDDDMYEPNVFENIKKMDNDIVIISMKRGYQIPKDASPDRMYHTTTLFAHPDNIKLGSISGQQVIVKGKIFKNQTFDENYQAWDYLAASHYKETEKDIVYLPDLYALFNYYEPQRWQRSNVAFGVMINDMVRCDMVFRQSQLGGDAFFVSNPESATKGLNKLLDIMESKGAEIGVLAHQDMFFRQGWVDKLKDQIALLPDSWVVCGVIGKDLSGNLCGNLHDMRIPHCINTDDIHVFPHEACCFDECVIIVNLKKNFRFDESLEGFDLYGTLAVCQAWEMGGTAWVVDAFCEHYSLRSFKWFPPVEFQKRYKALYDKYNHLGRIDTTVIGRIKED